MHLASEYKYSTLRVASVNNDQSDATTTMCLLTDGVLKVTKLLLRFTGISVLLGILVDGLH